MNKSTFFPILFLLLLGATNIKNYEHSYHTGNVTLVKIENGQTIHHTNCQLDYTITNDSQIDGRFQILDLPANWKIAPEFTFHGIITPVNSPISFGRRITRIHIADSSHPETTFEWETQCSFDDQPGTIQISKAAWGEYFYGRLESGSELSFHLE